MDVVINPEWPLACEQARSAAQCNDLDALKQAWQTLTRSAHPNLGGMAYNLGRWAAEWGHADCVQWLLPLAESDEQRTVLHVIMSTAMSSNQEALFVLLMENAMEPVSPRLLSQAAIGNRLHFLDLLLPRVDASVHRSEALTLAAMAGHSHIVDRLMPHSWSEHYPLAVFWATEGAARGWEAIVDKMWSPATAEGLLSLLCHPSDLAILDNSVRPEPAKIWFVAEQLADKWTPAQRRVLLGVFRPEHLARLVSMEEKHALACVLPQPQPRPAPRARV